MEQALLGRFVNGVNMRIFGQHEEGTILQIQNVARNAAQVALMADGQ